MADDDTTAAAPTGLGDLPMQPTGSGVADLEIAFERMRLAEEAAPPAPPADERAESEAHPS